jgi:hypothetical protein
MKTSKILTISLVILFFSISAIYAPLASAEEIILDDGKEGDVLTIDYDTQDTFLTKRPNVDIKKLIYSKEDGSKDVVLTLEVFGEIEDRGSLESELGILNSVTYIIQFSTTEGIYQVLYINKNCQVTFPNGTLKNITGFTKNGGVLTISFELTSTDETYEDMEAQSSDFKIDLSGEGDYYIDMVPDEPMIIVDAGGPSSGEIGEALKFTGDAYNYLGTSSSFTYEWDFGDGTTSNQRNTTHVYTSAGEYTVTLSVTDENGETAEDSITVSISGKANGENGSNQNQGSSNPDLILFVAIIVIVIILGSITLIFIIRRR